MPNTTFENNDNPCLTGKDIRDENFPVGSFLLRKPVRPIIKSFYRFARSADDIADNPNLDSNTKLALLKEMDRALSGLASPLIEVQPAEHLRCVLECNGLATDQARALLIAFQRDVCNSENHSWSDLLESCRFSANPVGRFLLEIHKETALSAITASDALCTVFQILNHLQDCRKDFMTLNRVYIPTNFLALESLDRNSLGEHRASPGLQRVFESIIDRVENLYTVCLPLLSSITCYRFRLESAVALSLAGSLIKRLRGQDLLASFQGLQWSDWVRSMTIGLSSGLFCCRHSRTKSVFKSQKTKRL